MKILEAAVRYLLFVALFIGTVVTILFIELWLPIKIAVVLFAAWLLYAVLIATAAYLSLIVDWAKLRLLTPLKGLGSLRSEVGNPDQAIVDPSHQK